MNTILRIPGLAVCIAIIAIIAACSSGDRNVPKDLKAEIPELQSPGGIWNAVESSGGITRLRVTESGRFHFIDQFGHQGSGTMTVSNGSQAFAEFELVTEFGLVFPDQTTRADCTLTGSVFQRQRFVIDVDCTTSAGLQSFRSFDLIYGANYERDSALDTIAGLFEDEFGLVTTVFPDGEMFNQEPVFGCILTGQVEVIDSDFNLYDVRFGYSNCTGQFQIFNGSEYEGLGVLDDRVPPESLEITAIGAVGELRLSELMTLRRR